MVELAVSLDLELLVGHSSTYHPNELYGVSESCGKRVISDTFSRNYCSIVFEQAYNVLNTLLAAI